MGKILGVSMKYRSRLFNFNRSTPLPKQIYIRYCTTICDAVSEPSRERFNSLVKKCSCILFRVYALFDSFTEMRCAECSRLFPTFVRWLAFFPVTLWDMISYKVTTPTFVILTHLQWSMNIQLWVFFYVHQARILYILSLQKTPTSKGQCIQDRLH